MPLEPGLNAQVVSDQPRQLHLESRRGRVIARVRQIRRIGADPEISSLLNRLQPFVLSRVRSRRPEEGGESDEEGSSHSKSPKTVRVPPTGRFLRNWSFGSSPTSRSPVTLPPPVTTATYCLPPTE